MSMSSRAAEFRALHEGEPFLIPNPWDAGSARMLEELGFEALATTSGGFAFTLGRADGDVTLDEVVEHTALVASAVAIPVSVDLENGYGASPEDAARAVSAAADAGAAGGSIEDWDADSGIYSLEAATERIVAAVEAARASGFVLTARAENFVRDNPDLDDTIARLQAYEAAGADVLYAPRLPGIDEVRAICDAVSKPVNVLGRPGMTMSEIADAGGRRVSIGAQLTWVAVAAAADAVVKIRDEGDFSVLAARLQGADWLG
jgi:2-methylisocitrate lyase-like PEP mutase family enzyme